LNKAALGPYLSIRAIHDNCLSNNMNGRWYISKCTISVLGNDVAHFLVYKRILFKYTLSVTLTFATYDLLVKYL